MMDQETLQLLGIPFIFLMGALAGYWGRKVGEYAENLCECGCGREVMKYTKCGRCIARTAKIQRDLDKYNEEVGSNNSTQTDGGHRYSLTDSPPSFPFGKPLDPLENEKED